MMITLKTIADTQLDTLAARVVYLMIKEEGGKGEDGWAAIRYTDFSKVTGMTRQGIGNVLKGLIDKGLIEKKQDKTKPNEVNQYRINHD
ncbi:MarR family transcriptional regulator [Pistricoccus aurantiacus]|uniref:MarR family transcriptional regulator n=1 Tax=Pistricoccus aurantiacus TaxID=1883414 RepID=UPI0036321CDC